MNLTLIIFALGLSCGIWQWLSPPKPIFKKPQLTHYQWPDCFEGQPLTMLPMTVVEHQFAKDFPGQVASFRCDDQQVILRYITRATRKVHPAADCFRASGYHIGDVKIHTDPNQAHWSGCQVSRAGKSFFVRERIVKIGCLSNEWTDASSWYWHALTHSEQGPWLAITVISQFTDV